MNSETISKFLSEKIDAGDFPSAVYLVAEKGEIIFTDALGCAVVEPEKIAAETETIYDLASLTKPLATGLLCARLIEKKELKLDKTVDFYLPEFKVYNYFKENKRDISINELLLHASRLPAWKPFYLFAKTRAEVLAEIVKTPLNFEQRGVAYSDLNFLILTFLIEKIYGERLDKISQEEICAPLKLKNTFFNPPEKLRQKIAASEFGNEYEKQTCKDSGLDVSNYDWRDYQIWGEVHDGNAWFMNGVSGHAGLFSTAEETFKIARQFLQNYTSLLKPETCKLFSTNFTKSLSEARSMAFELAETKDSTAGEALSKDSFGHLGFTGTSLWINPQKERIFILLTNRTHARSLPFANINAVRREFHGIAVELLGKI